MTRRKQAPPATAVKLPDPARIQKDVETAMRALPLQEPPGPGWSSLLDDSGVVVSSLAEKYVDIALASAAWRPPPTRKEVNERLAKIEEQAAGLLDSLRRLDGTTVDALHLAMKARNSRLRASAGMGIDPPPKALGDITARLEALKNAAAIAEIPAAAKVRRGPEQKWDALEIAKEAARHYNFLTGNPPTRSANRDGFPAFLTAIFDALGKRNDSVESFARQACEWWNRGGPRSDDITAIEKILANAPSALEEYASAADPILPLKAFEVGLDLPLLGRPRNSGRGRQCPAHSMIFPLPSATADRSCGTATPLRTTSALSWAYRPSSAIRRPRSYSSRRNSSPTSFRTDGAPLGVE